MLVDLLPRRAVALCVLHIVVFHMINAAGAMPTIMSRQLLGPGVVHATATPDPSNEWFISNFTQCVMTTSSDCSLSSLPSGEATLVYPPASDNTSCVDGSAFAFLVWPGATDRLLFMFAGGGACWQAPVFGGMVCKQNVAQSLLASGWHSGILNFTEPRNPFKNHTLVFPLYCSGDAFAGNTTWFNQHGAVRQYGYFNGLAAVKWAKANLDATLTQFTLTGWSAGNLAVMGWADYMLNHLTYESATVLSDSEVNYLPNNPMCAYVTSLFQGLCTTLFADYFNDCMSGRLTLWNFFRDTMKRHRTVAFGMIESKQDQRQKFFYEAFAASWGIQAQTNITGGEFYQGTVQYFRNWWREPNYVAFFVNGQQHILTIWLDGNTFYTTTPAGPDTTNSSSGIPLWQWVTGLVAHDAITSQCEGPALRDVSTNPDGCSGYLPHKVLRV